MRSVKQGLFGRYISVDKKSQIYVKPMNGDPNLGVL